MTLIRSNRGRDLRVDFFRGLALWWIYTDHIPGDVLGKFSLHNFAMCDAAEVFVLLAGFGAGIAYGSVMDRQGYLYAAADTLRRAWTLYIAHIFLFVVYTAQVAYSAAALDRMFYLEEARLNVLADAPFHGLLEALLLRFQPNLLNILPLYVALLLIFALALPLLRKPMLLFAASATVYAAVRVTGFNLPSWTGEAMVPQPVRLAVAVHYRRNHGLCAATYATLTLADRSARDTGPGGGDRHHMGDRHPSAYPCRDACASDPLRHHRGQDRTASVPPALHPVARVAGRAHGAARRAWLRSPVTGPLVLLGQNSLPVFCSGIFLGFLARLGLEADDNAAMQIAVNVLGAVAMVAVAGLTAWYRGKARASVPVPAQRQPVALPAVVRTDTG